MPVRIVTDWSKFLYVFCAVGLMAFAVAGVGILIGEGAAPVAAGVLLLLWVTIAVRIFRGENEPVVPPRAWWRMTARPRAGFVVAAVFGAQAVTLLLAALRGERDGLVVAVVYVVLATLFLNSALRLRRSAPTAG